MYLILLQLISIDLWTFDFVQKKDLQTMISKRLSLIERIGGCAVSRNNPKFLIVKSSFLSDGNLQ